jgi:uncharacterized repeat protein (TIGR01451 family)
MGALLTPATASADHSPVNCSGNKMDISLERDRPSGVYANGETITYIITITNNAPGACDVTNVTMHLRLPAADGRAQGAIVPILNNQAFRVPYNQTVVARVPYKLAVNPDVVDAVAAIQVTDGLLHDVPNDHPYRLLKSVGTDVVKPTISIDKKGSIEQGLAPAQVTYTYDVTNTSAAPIPLRQVGVLDDLCTNPTYAGGDNGDNLLTQGEVWHFTCTMLHQNAGVYINTAKACAINALDETDVCSPPDTWKVTLTPPPAPPPAVQGAVKGQQVAAAKCTLATPSGLKVRAREQTTIKVTVRNVDAGSVARITLPGGKVLRKKTNKDGVATFKVKPPKTGKATIRVADCADVERLTVRPARRVVAQRVPRVTG